MNDPYIYGPEGVLHDRFYWDKHLGAIPFKPISSVVTLESDWLLPSSNPPITVDEVKGALRCEDAADDVLLSSLMVAAVTYAQDVTGTIFAKSRISNRYAGFPAAENALSMTPEFLPPSTVSTSLATVGFPNKAGFQDVLTVLDGDFSVAVLNNYAVLIPSSSGWPVDDLDDESPLGVTAQIVVTPPGAGASASSSTRQLTVACQMLIAHWYANREAVSDARLAEVPMGVKMLLDNNTSHRGMF